jgi:hypothetical protein
MIGTIRKHSTWLWIVIIVVVIFTFVYWGSSSRMDSGRLGKANFGLIDGEPITKDEFGDAQREVYLRYFLTHGGVWPNQDTRTTGFDAEREIYQRLFFIRKLKEYDIEIDTHSVALAVDEEILRDFGRGAPNRLDAFVQQVLMPHAAAEDVERLLRHDLGIQQLISVVGLSGKLVTSEEAQFLYEREHQELSTEAIFFSGSNYLAGVPAAPADALARFYTNEMSAYHVPERVQVSYVAFGITNHFAQVEKQLTNLTALVEGKFRQLGTNYVRFGKTPELVKQRIREEVIRELASSDAQKKADDFDNDLFGMNPVQAGNVAALAKTNGLEIKITAPFDEETGPSEFDGGPNFAREAFRLNLEKPFPDQPILGRDAVYIIALYKRIPDEILPLNQIRDRVKADYKYRQAVLMARNAGEDFVRAVTNGLAHGKNFAGICADAKIRPVAVSPFSLGTRELPEVEDHVTLNQFKQIAFTTPPDKVSDLSPTHEGGVVLYVQKRLPLDETRMRSEMPAFVNLLHRAREQEALNLWLNKEASTSLRNTPLAQRNKQPSSAAGEAEP